ncbi:MAG: hypothetical protein IT379_27525 [Deltaproteobacteria bacterium]|nr:hypothetical protein [Deltaproteobacteria bacterium]
MARFLLILALAIAAACDPVDHCTINTTRCQGAVAQICDADERWFELMNCDEVAAQSGGTWSCQALPDQGGHACLPVDEAGADGGAQ